MYRLTRWRMPAECSSSSIPLLVARTAAALPRVGITVCSTIPMHAADADYFGRYSTAYLAKPVCREMHAAGWLAGRDGSPLVTSLALVKSWGNPYRPTRRRDAAVGDLHRRGSRQLPRACWTR